MAQLPCYYVQVRPPLAKPRRKGMPQVVEPNIRNLESLADAMEGHAYLLRGNTGKQKVRGLPGSRVASTCKADWFKTISFESPFLLIGR